MNVEPLVVTTRETGVDDDRSEDQCGDRPCNPRAIENLHHGAIAVVDTAGRVTHRAGDPHWPTFTRSTLKPFQALPFVRDGGHERYGWTTRELAMLCASHSGEDMHTRLVEGMLASADCAASDLQCGCHVPGWYAALGEPPPPNGDWTPVQHNCSGKHSGFLAACRQHGEPLADYLAPESPLQRRVAAAIATLTRLPADQLPTGTDGCSAPNYAMPLSSLAGLYAQLAQGDAAREEGFALEALRDAMTRHPELVSGTARSDRSLIELGAGDWVTKIGADGVQAIGIRSAGIGIAIKIADGSRDALYVAVVETLSQLGLLPAAATSGAASAATSAAISDAPAAGPFAPWLRRVIRNGRGRFTGRILPAFTLRAG